MQDNVGQTGSLFGAAGAALTSTAASICCIGPLGIALLGVNGAIWAAAIKPYRFYLLGGSLLLLGYAHWSMRRSDYCGEAEVCSTHSKQLSRFVLWAATALWFAAVAIQFAADRYWI